MHVARAVGCVLNTFVLLLAGSALPVTAYDKHGFRILFHFAKECPPGRPDVLVVVVSMLNTAPLPIKSIVLQAAVPKVLPASWAPETQNCLYVGGPFSGQQMALCVDCVDPL